MNHDDTAIFTAEQTHGRVLRPDNRLISHSEAVGWQSLHAAVFEEAPLRTSESSIGHPSLIYHLSRPTVVSRTVEGDRSEQALIGPRQFCLTPGESNTSWAHDGHPEILQIYLRQSVFANAVEELYGGDGSIADVTPRFAITDPLLEQLALAILSALHDGASEDRLYVETMAHMIAVHLARRHSTRVRSELEAPVAGLSHPTLRRLVEYIEAHLAGDLSLEAMAAEADVSVFYLSRAFKEALGQSPHQYVLTRRVERAKQLLRNTAEPIAEVALAVGFSSQSHLSAWFRRIVGVSPGAYRKIH